MTSPSYVYTVDPTGEVEERVVMQQVIDHCRSQQRSDWYCAFRRLVIEHPILDSGTLVDAELNELADLAPQLRAVYEPAPKGLSQGGELAQCGYCGQLLEPGRSPQSARWRCHSSDCLSHPQPLQISRTWRVGDCYRLKSPFYYYVHRPGRAELALEQEFQGDPRIVTQLWPDCDRYDLRVIFADGRVWGVDVKDWRSPAALGQRLAQIEPVVPPRCDHFWIVIPQQRLVARPDYINTLQRSWRRTKGSYADDADPVPVISDANWVKEVRNYARSIPGHPSP
jgi:hypothetical protein